jgi:hypothetical protein
MHLRPTSRYVYVLFTKRFCAAAQHSALAAPAGQGGKIVGRLSGGSCRCVPTFVVLHCSINILLPAFREPAGLPIACQLSAPNNSISGLEKGRIVVFL